MSVEGFERHLSSAVGLVEDFWELMATNNFRSVGALLSDDYTLEWPQSNECIRGRENFTAVNEGYPTAGSWRFAIQRLFGTSEEVVSEVLVSDGTRHDRVITFSTVRDGKISRQVEFWPENYPAPSWRQHLVEPLAPDVP